MRTLTIRYCPELSNLTERERDQLLVHSIAELKQNRRLVAELPTVLGVIATLVGILAAAFIPFPQSPPPPPRSPEWVQFRMAMAFVVPTFAGIVFSMIGHALRLKALRPYLKKRIERAAQNVRPIGG
jgi:hypothetical protein